MTSNAAATPATASAVHIPRVGLPAQRPTSPAEVAFLQAYHRAGLPVENRGAALELGRTICGNGRPWAPGDAGAATDFAPEKVVRVVELARTTLCPTVPTG